MSRLFRLIVLSAALTSAVAGQNNLPVFDSIITTAAVTEGKKISWDIVVTDADIGDSVQMYLIPPYDDTLYKGRAAFFNIDLGIWNFQFQPFYDFIDSGQIDLPITFYATDLKDTVSMPVVITVIDSNPPPILDPIADREIWEGVLLILLVSANDPDGTIPTLSASDLPANATFADSTNGKGVFTFLPDSTQYGGSSRDYPITFSAYDGDTTVTQIVTITVKGPNYPPVITDIADTTINEGDTLTLTIIAADPNMTYPQLYSSLLPSNATFEASDTGVAVFTFMPNFTQAGDTTVTFYATDGKSTDSLTVTITILDAGNQPPEFDPVPDTTIVEGVDTLFLTLRAVDPEGDPVTLALLDTLENSGFADNGDGTGSYFFAPDLTQGGAYEVGFTVTDDKSAVDTIAVSIVVTEVDFPPVLEIYPAIKQTINEGMYVRIQVAAKDTVPEGWNALPVEIFPPIDSAIFKGSADYRDNGDGTGVFEFTPEYTFLDASIPKTTLSLTFSATDGLDTARKDIEITLSDVPEDSQDPLLADTLTLLGAVWDTTIPGCHVAARIWNDSVIAAAMTGFRWAETWLKCDSVIFDPRFDFTTADYHSVYINNDSAFFLAVFIYADYRFLAPGDGKYFTAYFSYNPDSIDVDTIGEIRLDTAKVGPSGDFFFDKRTRQHPVFINPQQDVALGVASPYTYKPLVKLGSIRSADNAIRMQVLDRSTGSVLGVGSAIYGREIDSLSPTYELRLSFENAVPLGEMALGLRVYSESGAGWSYVNNPPATVLSASRMFPDPAIWAQTGGLQTTSYGADGAEGDSLLFHGMAGTTPEAGLSVGLMEPMITIPFKVLPVYESDPKTICFDTATIAGEPSSWLFSDRIGNAVTPRFSGAICFPVVPAPVDADGERTALPNTFSLSQNYPNPFNPATTILFSLPRRQQVKISVYNILGQAVRTLADRTYDAGIYAVVWDGLDKDDHPVASGIYLYRMESEGVGLTKKMVLLR